MHTSDLLTKNYVIYTLPMGEKKKELKKTLEKRILLFAFGLPILL